MSAPQTETASPAAKIFFPALMSRSISVVPPEVRERFLQVSKTLLQRYTTNLVKKVEFSSLFPTSQKNRGLFVTDSLLFGVPGFGSSSQSFVVNQTNTTYCPSQEIFLRRSWVKPVLVGAFAHLQQLIISLSHFSTLFCKNIVGGAAFLPPTESGVSCREIR